jgi:hypothetical protein
MRPPFTSPALALGAGLLTCLLVAGGDDPPPARSVKDLQKERVGVIAERLEQAKKAAKAGAGIGNEVAFWEYRLAVAKAELEGKTAELRKLYEMRLTAARAAEEAAERLHKAGAGSPAEVLESRDVRLEAEIAVARLRVVD